MKLLRFLLPAVMLMAWIPKQASAKSVVLPKAYLCGFIANFTDSVVYFTDIQEVDSVWFDQKTKFLLGRSSYSGQLREYFSNTLKMPHRTCIVLFGQTRKEAEKKLIKLKKQYTGKYAGKYEIRNLNENDFHFSSVEMNLDETNDQPAPRPEKKQKPKKDGKRPPRDGKMPPPRK